MRSVDNMGSKGSGEAPHCSKYFEEMDTKFADRPSDRPNVSPVALASSSRSSSLNLQGLDMSSLGGKIVMDRHLNRSKIWKPKKETSSGEDEVPGIIPFRNKKFGSLFKEGMMNKGSQNNRYFECYCCAKNSNSYSNVYFCYIP
ncbi:uncharacterized protein LOC123307965 isoform X2 [Coccinella septempunctata]|uniref:uncharacterized protein LOC123307965 isoform X2 n=1 Tax=Coccinella septempunctata TaxID=41139 RepID=UPI001D05EB0E|nr:uncharacterized protein LOC123307965 isoform X2 [Coccinella septempunctata]